MTKISIITPTYNRADLISETIESILNQDFKDFEYLIIDDGSKDNTKDIVSKYLKDERVKYYYHENIGESGTVNRGWSLAQSELVVIVNSDDPVKPEFLGVLVDFMDRNNKVIVGYPDWEMIDENGEVLKKCRVPEYDRAKMISSHYCYPGPGAVIRKSALPKLLEIRDIRYKYRSDLATWWKLCLYGGFARIPQTIARWRNHEGAATSSLPLKAAEEHELLIDDFFKITDLPYDILEVKDIAIKNAKITALNVRIALIKNLKERIKMIIPALKVFTLNFNYLKLLIRLFFGNTLYNKLRDKI